ncbi:MAG TPA: lipid-binding SYLF domain-containing protein [Pyrinomonadaceae bacterium]|nr:lipid-binding SYLF domain-containing protein [Pyrinomonadaceae bacterium]
MRVSFPAGRLTRALLMVALVSLGVCGVASVQAQQQRRPQQRTSRTGAASPRAKDAARHAQEAARVFGQIMRTPERAIPKELLEKAEAVAVFPGVLKAAFIVGGRKGQGVITRRTANGWSAPAFYNVGGGSVGLQVGGSKTDFVLLIMNEEGLKGLLEDKFEIGGEASIAAGPVGRTAGASTNATLDAGILTYSRSRGAFIGASLKGVAITPDNDLNESYYGKTASEVLSSGLRAPTLVRSFPLAVSRYSVRRK